MDTTHSNIFLEKKSLRLQMRALRDNLSLQEIALASKQAGTLMAEILISRHTKVLHTYLPIHKEVDTYSIISNAFNLGITVVVPKTLPARKLAHLQFSPGEKLVKGKYGTPYPSEERHYNGAIDIILVPGLAFDATFNRLGYGAGYYDSFLKEHPEALKIGLAYPFQYLPNIPVEPHDAPLDQILVVA